MKKSIKPIKLFENSVCLDVNGKFYWIDIFEDEKDIYSDWNQYIFFLDDSDDIKRKKFQENCDNFIMCSEIAIDYYLSNKTI